MSSAGIASTRRWDWDALIVGSGTDDDDVDDQQDYGEDHHHYQNNQYCFGQVVGLGCVDYQHDYVDDDYHQYYHDDHNNHYYIDEHHYTNVVYVLSLSILSPFCQNLTFCDSSWAPEVLYLEEIAILTHSFCQILTHNHL